MTQEAPPFPNHRFDFADTVVVLPQQDTGTVAGILYQDQQWYYLIDLASSQETWWPEEQLTFAPDTDPPSDLIPPSANVPENLS